MVSRGGVSDAGGPGRKSSHEAHRVTVCASCGQFRVSGHVDDQWFSVTFDLRWPMVLTPRDQAVLLKLIAMRPEEDQEIARIKKKLEHSSKMNRARLLELLKI